MTPQELKNSILQLAIQGKLVPQIASEGTGEELYKQIQAEKQALIKTGKIRKEKQLPEIKEEEISFEVPDTWKWTRLRDICTKIVDGDHNPPTGISMITDYWMLSAQNINNDHLENLDQVRYLTKDIFDKEDERTNLKKGDILLTIVGTLGRSCVFKDDYNLCFQRSVSVITTLVYNFYLKYVLDSGFVQFFMTANATGTAQKGFYLNQVEKLLIPLPPLAEQKRIVAKIEELLPLIDRYEEAYNKLEELNKSFPMDLQKSILQMAIQGKLVPQNPSEGTGEELYKQIQDEKARLTKKGITKKEKHLPEIAEDEILFDIPESWKWVRLSDVIDVRDGTHATPGYLPSGYPLITGKDFYTGAFDLSKTQYISKMDYDEIRQRSKVEIGDILFSMIGGNIGSMIKITEENFFEMAIKNVALFKQYDYQMPLTDYLFVFLKSQVKRMQSIAKGGAQSFMPLNTLRSYPFPLPPLAEQKRIVAKLEEILPLCEKLI